jgi:hypothetical protein
MKFVLTLSLLLPLLGYPTYAQIVEDPDKSRPTHHDAEDSHFHWHVERERIISRMAPAQKVWERHETFDKEELQAFLEHAEAGRPYIPRKRHEEVYANKAFIGET